MQLTKISAHAVLIYCALVSAAPSPVFRASGNHTLPSGCENEIKDLVYELQAFTARHEYNLISGTTRELAVRSSIPLLDTILSYLSKSGLANVVIDFVLLNPRLLDVSINATIFIIRNNLINLTDLFIALEKSGLVLSLLNAALDDPETLPGLLNLGKALLRENGINIFNKRDAIPEYFGVSNEQSMSLTKRESSLLDELLSALNDSGLAVTVVQHLLTTPELAQPSAHFLNSILRSGALSIPQLLIALKQSHLIGNLFHDILSDKALLTKFGDLVVTRVTSGIISKTMWDQA